MKALPAASKRTKNRLHEHPNLEIVHDGDAYLAGLPTKGKVLVKCLDIIHGERCEWIGWIPKNELDMTFKYKV